MNCCHALSVRALPHLAIAVWLLSFTACAHRVVSPVSPGARPAGTSVEGLELYVNPFVIEGLALSDDDTDVRQLERSFGRVLEHDIAFATVHLGETIPSDPVGPALQLDVHLKVEHFSIHTVIMDLLNLHPFLAGAVVPVWGDAVVESTLTVRRADGTEFKRYQKRYTESYENTFWSWYRNDYIENTFRSLYAQTFAAIATDLRGAGPDLFVAAAQLPSLAGPRTNPADVAISSATSSWRDEPPQERRSFGILHASLAPTPTSPLALVGRALGGVEVAAFAGFAKVSSNADTAAGKDLEVAAGDATQRGRRISLYKAPEETGLYWYPTVGYLSQRISISDFRHTLPLVEIPGATPVSAHCTDPGTGAAFDCGTPNSYRLDIQSGYAGARAGVDGVVGNDVVQLFLSLNAGLNLVEYRYLNAKIGAYDSTGKGWDFLRSGAFGATAGMRFPKAHLALRLIYDWEWYRSIKYAEPLSFEGPVSAETVIINGQPVAIPQEEPVNVDSASLTSSCFQIALAITF